MLLLAGSYFVPAAVPLSLLAPFAPAVLAAGLLVPVLNARATLLPAGDTLR